MHEHEDGTTESASPASTSRNTRLLAGLYVTAAVFTIGTVAATGSTIGNNLVSLLVFAGLVVWAENDGVKLPVIANISPSFMVVMASIAAFEDGDRVLAAAIVGGCGGLIFDVLRRRRFAAFLVNCAQYVVSAATAAVSYEALLPVHPVLAVVGAAATFAALNTSMILVAVVLDYRVPVRKVWADMGPALPNYLAFGLLGTLVGQLSSSLGPLAVVLLMTPVAIARATFSSIVELASAHDATIRVFLRAIEAKDAYTARHTERVCTFSLYIGEKLGLSQKRLAHLRQSALMHDIGKLAVPKHLLNKPGKLTDDEFAQVQRHAHVCIDILGLVDFLQPMTAAAAGHHARYDGGGYGGTGDRPLEAYIVSAADAFDAMTSTRSYRRALPMEVAFEELRAKSGSQFHPGCVEALIAAITERGERYGLGYEKDAVEFEVAPPVAGVGSAGLGDRAET